MHARPLTHACMHTLAHTSGAVEEGDDSSSEGEEESESENSQSEDEGEGGYYLRKRRPVIYQYQPVIQVREVTVTPSCLPP